MSALKRKLGVNGVEETESSGTDRSVSHAPPPKKPYRPFTLGSQSAPSPSTPLSKPSKLKAPSVAKPAPSSPGAGGQSETSPTANIPHAPHDTSSVRAEDTRKGAAVGDNAEGLLGSLPITKRKNGPERARYSSDDELARPTSVAARSRVRAERDVNEVRTALESLQAEVMVRLKRLEERQSGCEQRLGVVLHKLDMVLSRLGNLPPDPSPVSTSSLPQPVTVLKEEKPDILNLKLNEEPGPNPVADPSLSDICKHIATRDKKLDKPIVNKAPLKTFARNVMTTMLDIPGVKRPPMFYSKGGKPDYLPVEFRTRKGYSRPCPHWDKTFQENSPWVPTYAHQFRRMLPTDTRPWVVEGRELKLEQIIALMHDGPFKTLKGQWRQLKTASPGDVDVMEAGKRGVSSVERKCFVRRPYRNEVKAMVEPKWDAAWNKGVMSPEVSDSEGGVVVQRPSWRAGWFNSKLAAIDNAEQAKDLAEPTKHTRIKRRVESVETPLPTLRGADGAIVKIPLAMISKLWRKENAGWIEKNSHLIDMDTSKKPSVAKFVAANPAPVEPEDQDGEETGEEEGEEEGAEEGDGGPELLGGYGGQCYDRELVAVDAGEDADIEDEEEAENAGEGRGKGEIEGKGKERAKSRAMDESNIGVDSEFQIDPEVLQNPLSTQQTIHCPSSRVIGANPSTASFAASSGNISSNFRAICTPTAVKGLPEPEPHVAPIVSVSHTEDGHNPPIPPTIPQPLPDLRVPLPFLPPPPLLQQNPAPTTPECQTQTGRMAHTTAEQMALGLLTLAESETANPPEKETAWSSPGVKEQEDHRKRDDRKACSFREPREVKPVY